MVATILKKLWILTQQRKRRELLLYCSYMFIQKSQNAQNIQIKVHVISDVISETNFYLNSFSFARKSINARTQLSSTFLEHSAFISKILSRIIHRAREEWSSSLKNLSQINTFYMNAETLSDRKDIIGLMIQSWLPKIIRREQFLMLIYINISII